MALEIASINSGSNGNCYYVGNETDAVLIDVGISCKEVERRMLLKGLDIGRLRAIFISHEHTDHIKGLARLSNKYKIPVFITEKTARRGPHMISHLAQPFFPEIEVAIGDMCITGFAKKHDADDPHSFIVSYKGITVGIITDIGIACDQVVRYFKQCHAVFLESNYDEGMLMNGSYPVYLKKRISGGLGHLSNHQALELFRNHRAPFMTHLILSHLSKENNTPELAAAMFANVDMGNVHLTVASRYEVSEVYVIGAHLPKKNDGVQLGLFDQNASH